MNLSPSPVPPGQPCPRKAALIEALLNEADAREKRPRKARVFWAALKHALSKPEQRILKCGTCLKPFPVAERRARYDNAQPYCGKPCRDIALRKRRGAWEADQ